MNRVVEVFEVSLAWIKIQQKLALAVGGLIDICSMIIIKISRVGHVTYL